MQARSTFHVVSENFHFWFTATLKVLKIKSRNKEPWMGPIDFTSAGLSAKYFIGTAIKTKTRSEIPSRKPMILSLPIVVLNKCIMIMD